MFSHYVFKVRKSNYLFVFRDCDIIFELYIHLYSFLVSFFRNLLILDKHITLQENFDKKKFLM